MIEVDRSQIHSSTAFRPLARIIVGVGGAGCTVLDRLLIDGVDARELLAVNTDSQALTSSMAASKIQLGHALTHGLGAGGDPEVGMAAAQEALPELREAVAGREIVFIIAGLGGGTGSGSAPFMAHAAREEGAMVIGIVTLPFTFEGRRRNEQAVAALDHLRQLCHAVICFENDRMSELVPPKSGIQQAFTAADITQSECIRGILSMLAAPGVMKVGVADLLTVLRTDDSRCLFGYGESEGDNRSHEALARALRNPLMDRGRLLEESVNVLVHIAGANSLTLAEVEILMGELNRHIGENTQFLLGTGIDPKLGGKLSVTILGALGNPVTSVSKPAIMPEPASKEIIFPTATTQEVEIETDPSEPEALPAPVPAVVPAKTAATTAIPRLPKAVPLPQGEKPVSAANLEKQTQVKQEVLQFEPVSRGRFEKSEPTIIEGHDLDVPTVLRKGFRV